MAAGTRGGTVSPGVCVLVTDRRGVGGRAHRDVAAAAVAAGFFQALDVEVCEPPQVSLYRVLLQLVTQRRQLLLRQVPRPLVLDVLQSAGGAALAPQPLMKHEPQLQLKSYHRKERAASSPQTPYPLPLCDNLPTPIPASLAGVWGDPPSCTPCPPAHRRPPKAQLLPSSMAMPLKVAAL